MAVNEDGGVLAAQAARLDRGERAGAAELLHAQARHGAQGVSDGRLVALFHLASGDDRDGLRHFVNRLRRVGGCDDDFGRDSGDFELNVERGGSIARECDFASGAAREAARFSFDEVRARRETLEAVRALSVGGRRESKLRALARVERDGRAA